MPRRDCRPAACETRGWPTPPRPRADRWSETTSVCPCPSGSSLVWVAVELAQTGVQCEQLVEPRAALFDAAESPDQIERGEYLDPRHVLAPGQARRVLQRGPHALGGRILARLVDRAAAVQLRLVEVLVVVATQRQAMIDARDRGVELAALGLAVRHQGGVVRQRELAAQGGERCDDRTGALVVAGRPGEQGRRIALVRRQTVLAAQREDLAGHRRHRAAIARALMDGAAVQQ